MLNSNDIVVDFDKLRLLNTLDEYGKLESNWDGYNGVCPKAETIRDAKLFLTFLPNDVKLPVPMVAGDGEISFYWQDPISYLEVGFYGDNKCSGIYNTPCSKDGFDDMELNQASFDFNFLPCLKEMYKLVF